MWGIVRVAVWVAVLLLSQPVGWLAAAAASPDAKGLFYSATESTVGPPSDNSGGNVAPAMPRRTNPPSQAPTNRPQPMHSTPPWFGIAYWV